MRRLFALVLLVACAGPQPGQPPQVVFGRHECARCGMIVSDERTAAGFVGDDGESVAFDDLGEMLARLDEEPRLRARAWARDFGGGGWLPLAAAAVVHVPGLATPMGTGWAAFKTRQEAEAFVGAQARR